MPAPPGGAVVRWAILGTGVFAAKVAPILAKVPGCAIAAVASRRRDRAAAFIQRHGLTGAIPCLDRDLEALDIVDAVHIIVPNHEHVPWSLRLLQAQKHVLCEKPFTPFAAEARQVTDAARRADRVFAEGFMYLHHPQTHRLIQLGRERDNPDNPIGPLRRVRAFYRSTNRDPASLATRLRHSMRGGSIMDLGCYCISFARAVTGEEPAEVRASARRHFPWLPGLSVDRSAKFSMRFPSGVEFEGASAFDAPLEVFVELEGERGRVRTGWPWSPPGDRAILNFTRPDGRGTIEESIDHGGDRFANQYTRFARTVRGEAVLWPDHEWTVAQAAAMERVLDAAGVRFGR